MTPSRCTAGALAIGVALTLGACAVPTGDAGVDGAAAPDASADVARLIDAGGAADARGPSDAAVASDAARPPLIVAPWPGANAVAAVDRPNQFGPNLSGLHYQPAAGGAAAVLWAVQNDPALLHRLAPAGAAAWSPTTTEGWAAGKALRYPNGQGSPDAEGLTKAELTSAAVYVTAERDNDDNDTSRLSVLRFDTSVAGTTLTATHEWNLTADLPSVDPNLGLEGIAWVPDTFLVASGFHDESASAAYDPARYAGHGAGLFFVALEATGGLYAYALDHASGAVHRIATVASGQAAAVDLAFDRDVGYLWAACDNTCGNETSVLQIDTTAGSPSRGRFTLLRSFERPTTLGNLNDEGIAIAPEAECASGRKRFFWSDDDQTGGHALREDAVPCGAFIH